jgi:hypothetical protein
MGSVVVIAGKPAINTDIVTRVVLHIRFLQKRKTAHPADDFCSLTLYISKQAIVQTGCAVVKKLLLLADLPGNDFTQKLSEWLRV